MRRLREVTVALPTERGRAGGLAYALWMPAAGRAPAAAPAAGPAPAAARAGVVILHGAGSAKESHYDFARALVSAGLAALAFDQRGHGESQGALGGGALEDITAMGELLRERLGAPDAPLGLRGSSMGGYFAILAAEPLAARAVVAICPASAAGLRRGLRGGAFEFAAEVPALDAFLAGHELDRPVRDLAAPLLLLHAEGDERVPVEHSRQLAGLARHPDSRLVVVPGGHHRSVQHDGELQALSVRFLHRALDSPHLC